MHASNSLGKKYILKEDYQNILKNLAWFFLSDLVPFYREYYEKQNG